MASLSRPEMNDGDALEPALRSVDEAVAGASIPPAQRALARARAEVLHSAGGRGEEALTIARLAYAGELLLTVAVDLAAQPAHARRLIDELDLRASVPRVALGREVLQSGRLLGLPVGVAIEVRLALLAAFTTAASITLWTLPGGELQVVSEAGRPGADAQSARELARRLLTGGVTGAETASPVTGVALERLRPPPAAIVAEGMQEREGGALLLGVAAPVLAALLDRQALIVPDGGPSQETVLSSVERRLDRLRYDLHDGPQQDVHLLAQDLALFREQLRPMITGDPNAERALGRLDDLQAQLVALDGDLRRLSTAVQSPFFSPGSLPDALRAVTEAFAARTAVVPEVSFAGDLSGLTDSQQIALLSLVREALSNIRQHSEAGAVTIAISAASTGVTVEIRDDGVGFDPEANLISAARAGRLGLVGMHERVRMLGGVTRIESRPGAGTMISAMLPPWPAEERSSTPPE